MSDSVKPALEFLAKQIQELKIIRPPLVQAVNAVRAKEQFHKWKKQVVMLVGENLGPQYQQRLAKDWLETAFAGSDLYNELSDDIEMCLRHLYNLSNEIATQGLEGHNSVEHRSS